MGQTAGFAAGSWIVRQPPSSPEVNVEEIKSRIIELEINYTHQTNLIEELNMELTSANTRIDQLEHKVKSLSEMLGSLGPELTESPDE